MRVKLHLYEDTCIRTVNKGILWGNFMRYEDGSISPISRDERYLNQFMITAKIRIETYSDRVGVPELTFIAEKASKGKSTGERLYTSKATLWIEDHSIAYTSAYICTQLRDFLTDLLSNTGRVNAFAETLTPDYSDIGYQCSYFFIFKFCEVIAKRVVREYRKKLREFKKSHPEISEEESA